MAWDRFEIYDGYRLELRSRVVDTDTARRLLQGRRQHVFFPVRQDDGSVLLVWQVRICPCCGHSLPTRADQTPAERRAAASYREVSRGDDWAAPGLPADPEEHICPECGAVSAPWQKKLSVSVSRRGQKLTVTCGVPDLKSLLALPWPPRRTRELRFPATESCTFDLRSGRSYLRLTAADGTLQAARDVTFDSTPWTGGPLYTLLVTENPARRRILRLLGRLSGGPLPYPAAALSPRLLIALTLFTGYPRRFYDAIPYEEGTWRLDGRFRTLCRRLHRCADVPRLLAGSRLPGGKTVHRLFFGEPGFLFFLPETELLWGLLGDVNRFRALLSVRSVYELLFFLRQFPRTAVFFRDYAAVKGKAELVRRGKRLSEELGDYARRYADLDEARQRREQQMWRGGRADRVMQAAERYSRSIWADDDRLTDCITDGYAFVWLRSVNAYLEAGRALCNCLTEWQEQENPVVGVMRNGQFVAAVALNEDQVVQAHTRHNGSIDDDPDLLRAFRRWMDRFCLTDARGESGNEYMFAPDGEDDLPF